MCVYGLGVYMFAAVSEMYVFRCMYIYGLGVCCMCVYGLGVYMFAVSEMYVFRCMVQVYVCLVGFQPCLRVCLCVRKSVLKCM